MIKDTEINEAIEHLKNGDVILYPTDTVWGLGCDATNAEAVKKIFAIKKRDDSKSLVILASDMDMICRYIKIIPDMAVTLTDITDSPLTIIYPGAIVDPESKGYGLAPNVVAEDQSVAIRIPMNEFCVRLIQKFRRPIVSTSANISGATTPSCYNEISEEILSAADWVAKPIYEKGATGKPSSIIKMGLHSEVEIIRK